MPRFIHGQWLLNVSLAFVQSTHISMVGKVDVIWVSVPMATAVIINVAGACW